MTPTAKELWESDYYEARNGGMGKESAADCADALREARQAAGAEGLAKAKADALALWAVRTLDAWAGADEKRYVVVGPCYAGLQWYCTLWHTERKCEVGPFHAPTPDAARLAAADALALEYVTSGRQKTRDLQRRDPLEGRDRERARREGGNVTKLCQRVFTNRETQDQHECAKPATHEAWGDTLLCDDCLHEMFEDEPSESYDVNVIKLREAPAASAPKAPAKD